MSHTTTNALHPAQIAILNGQNSMPAVARAAVAFAVVVTKWDTHRKTRRALAKLSPHELDDIGLCRLSAMREAAKPFWRD